MPNNFTTAPQSSVCGIAARIIPETASGPVSAANPLPTAAGNLKGEAGNTNETGTTARTAGNWDTLQCLTDTVFSLLTDSLQSGGDAITGITLPAGTVLFGHFTAFTLTSGSVRAYNRA